MNMNMHTLMCMCMSHDGHVTRGDSRDYGERGYGEQGYSEQGYGEHYAGYGVDEEVLEAAYDAGAYMASGTRATAVSPLTTASRIRRALRRLRCNLLQRNASVTYKPVD